jgi:deferrochelatase/peroxidase EfeB/cytochrome P450
MTDQAPATREETRNNVQAHFLKASKFQIGRDSAPRNWSLFFFFRILPQAEFDVMMHRMKSALNDDRSGAKDELWQDFAQTAYVNAGLVEQRLADNPKSEPDRPAEAFLNWLKAIVSADKSGIMKTADAMLNVPPSPSIESQAANRTKVPQTLTLTNVDWADPTKWMQDKFRQGLDVNFLRSLVRIYTRPGDYAAHLQSLSKKVGTAVPEDLLGPLPVVALYEILRQCAPAMMNPAADPAKPSAGIVRGEASERPEGDTVDATPINIAFTYSGMAALKLNDTTLASFPDAFKQGMAARAERLHDTGPSAPDNWEGELGLPSVHGYFTGGFALGEDNAAKESFWKAMRRDVEAFNDPVNENGQMLRFGFRVLFRLFGLEILHMELGQYPYDVEDDGAIKDRKYRLEHFGFRDGLSQPFVDMGLGDTLPGGGTPGRNHSWIPVAPGEIFLNMPDEDGETQSLPVNKNLRLGATFLVFRKLEQDVVGFRSFLSRRRPRDQDAQNALAAHIVGRWPNGVPLVLSPHHERMVDEQREAALNAFRYAADDPLGKKCPLGAHIRRANPRDIGGRDEVRRHRILRRGISYGGPLLKEDALNDGERRGLLFIAANSRIEEQFEVIQANWINGGEYLGQAGLGRCPLTGDHSGAVSDSFLEAGASAPVTGLPRFVTTRGGDYFFAPGIGALREIANGDRFDPEKGEIPFAGFSMGDATTPSLFDPDRLKRYGKIILQDDTKTAIHIELAVAPDSDDSSLNSSLKKLCFIGRYNDVKAVLNNLDESRQLAFSVRQYTRTGRDITRGFDMIVGTEDAEPTQSTRKRLQAVLNKAWEALLQARASAEMPDVRTIAKSASDDAVRRTAYDRRIDLVNDLAAPVTFAIITDLYGIRAPDWLTELGASMRFAHQHIGQLPPEWIAKLIGKEPDNPGLATIQIWSALILADLIGNVKSISALHTLARQAGSEMLTYLDTVISVARASPIRSSKTLLGAFVENEKEIEKLYKGGNPCGGNDWRSLYYNDVSTILLEIVGTTMASTPLAFASVMGALFKYRLDLPTLLHLPSLVQMPVDQVLSRIIYEADRLNPTLGLRMRYCEKETKLGNAKIAAGEWVASLIAAANVDPRAFTEPFRFKLDRPDTYLLFNEAKNSRTCWGRDRVAMVVLQECLMAASRLQGLRGVAGKGGEPSKLAGVTTSLPARFTQVASKQAAP